MESLQPVPKTFRCPNSQKRDPRDSDEGSDDGGMGGGAIVKKGEGEFAFFMCQIRHFSPIFDFGISNLTDY